MSTESEAEIESLEARCAELYRYWQRGDAYATFHERHGHLDAEVFRRQADAWLSDYDAAVRDLERLRAAADRQRGSD